MTTDDNDPDDAPKAEDGIASDRSTGRPGRALLLRIAMMLTLALLPLGIIAVTQTQRAMEAARGTYQASLRAQTARIAAPEREAIVVAFGVLRGLSDALAILEPDDPACSALMVRTAATNERVSFVGHTDENGISRCNNFEQEIDFSDNPSTVRLYENPAPNVEFNPHGEASELPVVIVSEPVYSPDGAFRGIVSLSFPGGDLVAAREPADLTAEVDVLTFNARGEILTTDMSDARLQDVLPMDISLQDLAGTPTRVFSAVSGDGAVRDFALVPIAPGRAYVLGVWRPVAPLLRQDVRINAALLFPLVMWLISLVVALLAIRNQVIRPIKALGLRMRSFADGRRMLHSDAIANAPAEIYEIGETFETMARKIMRDEADLENALYERDVLLKEVHHRVKNNLQLMSSIMNMQIRRAHTPEAKEALRHVQDRLTSLATVHRGLYQAPEVSRVRVDTLLEDLFAQLSSLASGAEPTYKLTMDLAPIALVPDQAGPLALLATEAFTNALKYCCPNQSGADFIDVSLSVRSDEGDDVVTFEISNSVATPRVDAELPRLGKQLITAFAQQLEAELAQDGDADHYKVTVTFRPEPFTP